MKHLGDITKINGADVPPVNVIIGGSPCQDLSVAGRREGLKGERSGLFMEQIRIIKEMRSESERNGATDVQPRYMVWENVPGAFSSNKGQDFKAVLEETIGVVEKENKPDIPIPEGGWHYSGCIVGDGFSVAWRVFDAQFWGVPQRRRRIALIADFGGFTAPEILFECESVSGNITQSGTPWEEFTRIVAQRFNSADRKSTGAGIAYSFDSLSSNSMKSNNPNSGCRKVDIAKTVDTTIPNPSKNQGGICILNDQGGSVMDVKENADVSPTIRAEMHGHTPTVYDVTRRHNNVTECEQAPTVTLHMVPGGQHTHSCIGVDLHSCSITGDKTMTMTSSKADAQHVPSTICVRERCGCEGGGKGCLIQNERSGTLAVNNDQFVCALDRAAFNQGINAQYNPEISESGINSTLTAKEPSAVCAGFSSRAGSKSGSIAYQNEVAPTLRSGLLDTSVILPNSAVRRLTPLECERLQGFPDNWTNIGDYIDSEGKNRKTSDTARYKALGNSIALPSWVWVLERLSFYCDNDRTMASLFDGIGGFPLIWETLNGKGTCLWASEIEEFPIAVTNYHFNKGE